MDLATLSRLGVDTGLVWVAIVLLCLELLEQKMVDARPTVL
jgi:hypothetical protein